MDRRTLLLVAASGVVAACAPSSSSPPSGAPAATSAPAQASGQTNHVKVSQRVAALSFVTFYVARNKQFFAQQRIDTEHLTSGGTGPDTQALLSGDVDFNFTAGTNQMDAFKQGRKLPCVLNALDHNVINMVMRTEVAQERGITEQTPLADKLKALKGLNIAATRPGALTFQMAEALVKRAGLEPQKDVPVLGVGEGQALIAALETGQVDLFLTAVPIPEQAIARGKAMMFINNAAGEDPSIIPFAMSILLVRPDYAQQNADLVKRFVTASQQADAWIKQASPEEIADVVTPDFGSIQRDVLVAGCASAQAAVNATGSMDRKAIANMVELSQSDVDVDGLYGLFTDQYLKA
jgi:NitT/TauT family transport system substrate-binding protein